MPISDGAFSGTGFGMQLRGIMFRLAQHGHEITWLDLQHFGAPQVIHDYDFPDLPHKNAKITVVGNWGDPRKFGTQIFVKHYKTYTPDLVFLMGDPHVLGGYVGSVQGKLLSGYVALKKKLGFPLLFYVTLDGTPIHPNMVEFLNVPNVLVTMTNWAKREYAKMGVQSNTVPHGVNWKWWSTTKETKRLTKQKYGIPEDTVLYVNWDVNQYRKRDDALLRCWRDSKPEYKKVKLLLYTDWYCRLGFDIDKLIKQYHVPRNTVISPHDLTGEQKLWKNAEPITKLKEIVQMGDVYGTATSGEGFGVCMLEAQCLGMPVIAPNYSSIPEVVRAGIKVPLYRGQSGKFRWHDNLRHVEGGIVNEKKFTKALNTLYEDNELRVNMGLKAKSESRMFDFDTQIMPLWLRLLDQLDTDVIFMREVLST